MNDAASESGSLSSSGWKLVPVEPTAPMLTALWNRKDVGSPSALADAYRAMLDLAPKAPSAWQPIETAPRHGWALLYAPPENLYERPAGRVGEMRVTSRNLWGRATHWIPLPVAPPSVAPADPMDWPLPCDVTVGNSTHCKGTSLGALVARMRMLHREAFGDPPSQEEAARNLAELHLYALDTDPASTRSTG